jgi:hypothetical protein
MDAAGECLTYHETITRVYLADAQPEQRSALRFLLLDLMMEVVAKDSDWSATLAKAPTTGLDMLPIGLVHP